MHLWCRFLSFKLYYIIWLMKTMVSLQLWLQNPCVTPWYVFYDFEEWELQDVVQLYAGSKTAAVLEAAKQYGQWPLIHLNKSLDIVKCFLRNWLTHISDISEALATNLSTKLNLTHVSDIRMSSQHKRRRVSLSYSKFVKYQLYFLHQKMGWLSIALGFQSPGGAFLAFWSSFFCWKWKCNEIGLICQGRA